MAWLTQTSGLYMVGWVGDQTCEHLSDPLAGGDPCVQLRLSFPLLPTRGIQGHRATNLCVLEGCAFLLLKRLILSSRRELDPEPQNLRWEGGPAPSGPCICYWVVP